MATSIHQESYRSLKASLHQAGRVARAGGRWRLAHAVSVLHRSREREREGSGRGYWRSTALHAAGRAQLQHRQQRRAGQAGRQYHNHHRCMQWWLPGASQSRAGPARAVLGQCKAIRRQRSDSDRSDDMSMQLSLHPPAPHPCIIVSCGMCGSQRR